MPRTADDHLFAGGIGCCFCCFAVFLAIFIGTSLGSVETTQWALKYNWWSESVDQETMLTPGLKWVGMGNYLIFFPNVNRNVFFRDFRSGSNFGSEDDIIRDPIAVRTLDGLSINLELEFTYQLQPENLRKMYLLIGGSWTDILVQISQSVIDNYACKFTAQEFYLNRTLIQQTFTDQVRDTLSSQLFMTLKTLQLQPAHFPDAYSHSIKLTQYYNTDIEVAVQEQKTVSIQKQTEKKIAEVLAEKTVVEAEAEAAKIQYQNEAEVSQFIFRQEKQAEGYKKALDFYGTADSNPDAAIGNFANHMRVRALQEHDKKHAAVKIS